MRRIVLRKLVLLAWLLLLGPIALFPPRKFTFAGIYGDFEGAHDPLPHMYLANRPDSFDGIKAHIGSARLYEATDWHRDQAATRSDGSLTGTVRPVEIDLGGLLAEWMIVSSLAGVVLILLPRPVEERP